MEPKITKCNLIQIKTSRIFLCCYYDLNIKLEMIWIFLHVIIFYVFFYYYCVDFLIHFSSVGVSATITEVKLIRSNEARNMTKWIQTETKRN